MSPQLATIIGSVVSAIITAVGSIVAAVIQARRGIPRRRIRPTVVATAAIGIVATALVALGALVWLGVLAVVVLIGAVVQRLRSTNRELGDLMMVKLAMGLIVVISIFAVGYTSAEFGKRPKPVSGPSSDQVDTWKKLRQKLCAGNKQGGYRVQPWPYPEWIKGKSGLYREVIIYSKESAPLLFDATKYMIPYEQRAKFDPSVNSFTAEVLAPMRQLEFPYGVYVRGSADKPTFARKAVDPSFIGPILLVRALSPNQYSKENDLQTVQIGETYENGDLPALRAKYLSWILSGPNYGVHPVMVNGGVYPEMDKNYRNAVVVVYVELPAWVRELDGAVPCLNVQ